MIKQPKIFVTLNRDNIEAYTPKYAVDIILPYIPKKKRYWIFFKRPTVIWAPFSRTEHNFVNYLRQLGYKVINTHYDPETKQGKDFLTYKPDFKFDIILDNPPYKNKTLFVKKAFEHNKPFALLLPFNCFGDNGIPNLYITNNVDPQMLIPKQRAEFHNQNNRGISFKTVFICRDVLPKQLMFVDMKRIKLVTGEE